MRLLVSAAQPRIEGEDLEFPDEIMAQMFTTGAAKPKGTLMFNIEVTDEVQGWVRHFLSTAISAIGAASAASLPITLSSPITVISLFISTTSLGVKIGTILRPLRA